MAAVAGAGIIAFIVFMQSARPLNSPAPALAEIEQVIDLAGFGLSQVSVTGHRYTPDSDILDAVGLDTARTMLTFDSRAARQRIEELPWVEQATIDRVPPDRLEVRVTERSPFAVWTRGNRHDLIDKTGKVLSSVPAGAMPALPRVAGEGAAREAARLFALLAGHADLASRVVVAERVAQRRWMLRLADGSTVQLPARGEAGAVDRALGVAAAMRGSGPSEIDVRIAERTLVRTPDGRTETVERATRGATGGT
jgi:cell division protein FtsQ